MMTTDIKTFTPFIALVTERDVPSNFAIFAVIGGPPRFLKFDFDPALKGPELHAFVLEEIERRLGDFSGQVPLMGPVQSYVVNHRPDYAERFDMEGNLVATLGQAFYPGESRITMKGRDVTGPLQVMLGVKKKKKKK
jgi:hypothetical protein